MNNIQKTLFTSILILTFFLMYKMVLAENTTSVMLYGSSAWLLAVFLKAGLEEQLK